MSRPSFRTESLLAATCLLAAFLLGASEFMNLFHLTPPGGEAKEAISSMHQHHGALLVLAVAAVIALIVAAVTGSKPAAAAVAICGVIALLIFLIGDLPDANKIGTLSSSQDSFIDAKAMPQPGFWFELVGALILSVAGTAYATLPDDRIKLFERSESAGGRRGLLDWSRTPGSE